MKIKIAADDLTGKHRGLSFNEAAGAYDTALGAIMEQAKEALNNRAPDSDTPGGGDALADLGWILEGLAAWIAESPDESSAWAMLERLLSEVKLYAERASATENQIKSALKALYKVLPDGPTKSGMGDMIAPADMRMSEDAETWKLHRRVQGLAAADSISYGDALDRIRGGGRLDHGRTAARFRVFRGRESAA